MLEQISLQDVLFLDIETVPAYRNYASLPERFRLLWDRKASRISDGEITDPEQIYRRAGIYAEFGKIICISCGIFRDNILRIKSFYGHDEKILLQEFAGMLNQHFSGKGKQLCAHNGKEFDFPYIARRMLINSIRIPAILDTAGKKPWEVNHLDTMELWKFGDFKSYTSLDLLSALFEIPSPKDDIDGSQVGEVYWEQEDLERIVIYCQRDVTAVFQLMLRFTGRELLREDQIQYID